MAMIRMTEQMIARIPAATSRLKEYSSLLLFIRISKPALILAYTPHAIRMSDPEAKSIYFYKENIFSMKS